MGRGGKGPGRRPPEGRDRREGRPHQGPRPRIDPAREAAYEAIAAVHRDDAYANLVLPAILRERGMGGRDAALATELTYGTLRMKGTLDAIIASCAGREMDRVDPPVRDALRLGVYQLLYMRVPPHAATSTTVDLVRFLSPGAAGFANAVLRKAGEHDKDQWLARMTSSESMDPFDRLALIHAHPLWIVRAFADAARKSDDSESIAFVERVLEANNLPAKVVICVRPGKGDPGALAEDIRATRGQYGQYAVVLPGGSPGDLRAIAEGRAHVQDEGSQLVAEALLHADLDGGSDRLWLDMCAGPGGKTGLLGALAAQRGARVTATEIVDHRADLVRRAVRGLPVDVHTADGRDVGTHEVLPEQGFDRVLVDVPCTGLGSLRRRPEARWRRQPSDLPALTKLQRELMVAALRAVRPGGVVAYATCSPHLAETKVSVEAAVRRAARDSHPIQVEHVDARSFLPRGMPDLGPGPDVQLWPHCHGTDAMYLSILRRR